MKPSELTKRYILFIISLFFSGVGVAFTKSGELGVSPISSVANVLSLRFDAISIGTWLTITNCILLLGQILLLRRSFKPIQLLQIPLSLLFGWFTDIGMLIAGIVPVNSYPMQLVMVISGVAILGFGVALAVIANVIMNSGEAFVKALSDVLKKDFSNVKIAFDVSWVLLSILISLVLCGGRIVGTREGTLIAAVCTGLFVKLFTRLLKSPLEKLLTGGSAKKA